MEVIAGKKKTHGGFSVAAIDYKRVVGYHLISPIRLHLSKVVKTPPRYNPFLTRQVHFTWFQPTKSTVIMVELHFCTMWAPVESWSSHPIVLRNINHKFIEVIFANLTIENGGLTIIH